MPDFEDFLLEGGWKFVFPDDEFECPYCGYMITPEDNIEVIAEGRFKCPGCGEEIEIK